MHHKTDAKWLMRECEKAESITELAQVALAEMHKFEGGVEFVSGPITTGGLENPEANLKVFSGTIAALQRLGRPIFNQMPYERRIFFLREHWQATDPANEGKYYMPVLHVFYGSLIWTGRIKRAWFIPGWRSSFGARWERVQFTQAGVELCDLTKAWMRQEVYERT